MGFFSFLSGKTPEALMENGDLLFDRGQFGLAKIDYEKARDRHGKKPARARDFLENLDSKVARCCDALARQHLNKGHELMESGCHREAGEILSLALELTASPGLVQDIETALNVCRSSSREPEHGAVDEKRADPDTQPGVAQLPDEELDSQEALETFEVILSTLSQDEQAAYGEYGDAFVQGVVALNAGDFQGALTALEQAVEENASTENYIALELGTALLNLGDLHRAEALLMGFLAWCPGSVRGYYVLCEVLWMQKAFDRAHRVLDACPDSMTHWVPMVLLKGETWCLEGELKKAETLYREALDQNGMDDSILRALAAVYETRGYPDKAFQLYSGLMASCSGCGRAPDTELKQKFAHAGVASGIMTLQIIDIYLDLVMEDPDNRALYYENVSAVYEHLGNSEEARRFKAFALELQEK
ncbi:Tetratricopeptide repeat-containing protein [Desulfocicer vacuolatum DSM 3385]|uniref:Tetratricopeptide repeat-containing protein n=1 Tax=Desulfocicer vacuolatum DSM 3385 TaxID=1121400 RepID=A0A1W2BRM3_9BACT|nr:tetratricopeptide repeat protein [Desulfocicer vacuolatum]SMC75539.1 Tetratricopeptide repeat-containing protein [Desulfocicer vacuolatum DSM 3385]